MTPGMGKKKGEEDRWGDVFSVSEIMAAIDDGGYPLEVTLLHEFRDGDMHPQIGSWMPTGPDGSEPRELDLIAQVDANSFKTDASIHVGIYFFIEAKNLGKTRCLVGIADPVMSETDLARNLGRFTGIYSQNGLPRTLPQIYAQLEPLAKGAQCVHWTMVSKPSGSKAKAEMDNRYAESMRTVVKACHWHQVSWNEFSRKRGTKGDLRIALPVMIVDTDELSVFEPASRTLRRVDKFHLVQGWDVGGKARWSPVTVVRAGAVGHFIREARKVQQGLERYLGADRSAIWEELAVDWDRAQQQQPGSSNDDGGDKSVARSES